MKSVCIVDDDSIYVMLAKRLISLNRLSDDVCEFSEGREAFQGLKLRIDKGEHLPDVIFLDVNMPIWDGWDFLDEFSKLEISKRPEIYIVTSSTQSLDLEKAATYPIVSRCLTKPLELEDLKTILQGSI
jgi:CheY-like chemotaxis protein